MRLLVRVSVTVILVGVIIWQLGGVGEVVEVMKRVHPAYIILALLVNTADRALMTFKWAQLLRSRGVQLSFFYGMKVYCASMIWGLFLPTTMGADAIRAYSTTRAGLNSNEIVASIIIERIVGFLSALVLGLLSLILLGSLAVFDGRLHLVASLGGVMLAGAIIIFVLSFTDRLFKLVHHRLLYPFQDTRIMKRLRQVHSTYQAYHNVKGSLAIFFGLTFSEQLLPILYAWLIALGLGLNVSLLFIVGALPLAMLISRIPISVDGLGVFEGVFVLLMSLTGISAAEAVAIALIGRFLQITSWSPWWLAYVAGNGVAFPHVLPEGQ
jgi:uncharacterized protein (TIRG00374 family)